MAVTKPFEAIVRSKEKGIYTTQLSQKTSINKNGSVSLIKIDVALISPDYVHNEH